MSVLILSVLVVLVLVTEDVSGVDISGDDVSGVMAFVVLTSVAVATCGGDVSVFPNQWGLFRLTLLCVYPLTLF